MSNMRHGTEQEICFMPTLQWEKEDSSDIPKLNHNPQDFQIDIASSGKSTPCSPTPIQCSLITGYNLT